MPLAELFNDFHPGVRNCVLYRSRPLIDIVDYLEDEMDQKVDQPFFRFPAVLREMVGECEQTGKCRKRKLDKKSNIVSSYEPKAKVQVTNSDKFQVTMDTSNYQPEEIVVKVVNDKLAISAKHEAKGKDFYEYHEMYRSIDLPEGVDPNAVSSRLNTNGQLTVEAPTVPPKDAVNERIIPIERSKEQIAETLEKDAQEHDSESK